MDALLREHHTEFGTKLLRAKVREKKYRKTDRLIHTRQYTQQHISYLYQLEFVSMKERRKKKHHNEIHH